MTLVITGGLRKPADFAKALALGADAVAVSNAAIQAIGCLGMRACHTNNCPVGIATQKPSLTARIEVEKSARRLANFFEASVELMKIMARACGHSHLNQLSHPTISRPGKRTWHASPASPTAASAGEGRYRYLANALLAAGISSTVPR